MDLARVVLLLQSDASALMGYTGGVLMRTLGRATGAGLTTVALVAWIAVPPLVAWRVFRRRDM